MISMSDSIDNGQLVKNQCFNNNFTFSLRPPVYVGPRRSLSDSKGYFSANDILSKWSLFRPRLDFGSPQTTDVYQQVS
jgi:hypothetical protein